jgi:hypothetical protein
MAGPGDVARCQCAMLGGSQRRNNRGRPRDSGALSHVKAHTEAGVMALQSHLDPGPSSTVAGDLGMVGCARSPGPGPEPGLVIEVLSNCPAVQDLV